MDYYTLDEFASLLKVTKQTLRNWDKNSKLIPHHKSDSGRRYYSEEQLNNFVGIKETIRKPRKIIGYCRVSSLKQKDDLERQTEHVKTYMYAKGYSFEIITDTGSGINYNKKGLLEVIDMVEKDEVDKIVILYKDRLLRFGYDLFENICNHHNTVIEIIDNTKKSDEEEVVEDLVQIITVFSCKLQGKRAKKTKEIIKELKDDKIN